MRLDEEQCVLLTTYRRDGTPISTPVWIVSLGDDRLGFYTGRSSGKTKRLRHTSRVILQPCNYRGVVKAGTSPIEATAEVVTGPVYEQIVRLIKQKYGFRVTLTKALATLTNRLKGEQITYDRGIVITLPPSGEAPKSTPQAESEVAT